MKNSNLELELIEAQRIIFTLENVSKAASGHIEFLTKECKELRRLIDNNLKCPQCGSFEGIKIPRNERIYCEDCGWPSEDFSKLK